MTKLTRIAPALLLITCALCVSEARADTFVVTGGSAVVGSALGGDFSFLGSGMSVAGHLAWGPGIEPFHPGQTFGVLTRNTSGDIGAGPATVNGTFYPQIFYGGVIDLNLVMPPLDWREGTFSIVVPFTLTGTLSGCATNNENQGPCAGGLVFDTLLTGHGLANINLFGFVGTHPSLSISSITYNFADPVPEPATLVLLSTGLAGAAAAARRRRRKAGR
ncbi:MAG TPA: PEP-CTERM sorting domain-containing protein [Pyrinomonadaceae bacterium]|nr:PEP-CTERM sorting domain-containing protein [Pyrinomonadaceae bacterium]